MSKKYYWLKLKNDFFSQPRIKKLRTLAGGDTYTIIYLKMQLLSLQSNGLLFFEGIEEDFANEIALTIDETPANVEVTLQYLIHQGLMEVLSEKEFLMTETQALIGSESDSAERVRRCRERKNALLCNDDVTRCNTEIDIEKEIEIEPDKEIEEKPHKKAKRFVKPTIKDVADYCKQRGNGIDAEYFINHYESNGWKVGKSDMKDWKAAVRTWEHQNFKGDKKANTFSRATKTEFGISREADKDVRF